MITMTEATKELGMSREAVRLRLLRLGMTKKYYEEKVGSTMPHRCLSDEQFEALKAMGPRQSTGGYDG